MIKQTAWLIAAAMMTSAFPVVLHAAYDSNDENKLTQITYNYDGEDHTRYMEKLDRGLVAIKTDNGVFLSWRLFDSEDAILGSAKSNVSFNIYCGDEKIAEVKRVTNYTDTEFGTSYSVAPVVNGVEGERCEAVEVQNSNYFDIALQKPDPETIIKPDGTTYIVEKKDSDGNVIDTQDIFPFYPTDCSVGDLDGDGEYEIIVKWVSIENDVGNGGYSGTIRYAAYKLDGTRMWENDINLGKNVYSSAHTAQFLVYDFDGDGKSEMIVQTSLGSRDSAGNYVSHSAAPNSDIYKFTDKDNSSADYRTGGKAIYTGEEFLTVFNGETGEAMDTINLPTARIPGSNGTEFGDIDKTLGNRSNRFYASVAYLDGEKPYAVYGRGYYFGKNGKQRTSICGVSFNNGRLSADYRFDTEKGQPGYYEGAYKYVGNGNHNCTVADVDNDGKDEFITGALCMEVDDDNNFRPRWCTFMEHGDALHIGDYDPTHKGLEFFTVHEDPGPNNMSGETVEINYGMSVIDAYNGDILFHEGAAKDTGRGVMANIGIGGYYQIWSSNNNNLYMSNGGTSYTAGSKSGLSQNFRIFWDGDLYDELLDGTGITNWNGSGMHKIFDAAEYDCVKINGTKANPGIQADLFGDWREEVVYPTSDGSALRVFTTTVPTDYKIKTLMHDPVYRSGVAAEQTAYNQPPHIGFYLSDEIFRAAVIGLEITGDYKTDYVVGEPLNSDGLKVTAQFNDEDEPYRDVSEYVVITGYDTYAAGEQEITVKYGDAAATFTVKVDSGFEINENGIITGYVLNNTTAILPTVINGTTVKGIAADALKNTALENLIINEDELEIGEDAFPYGMTITGYLGSDAHVYAASHDINFVEIDTREYIANITYSENAYNVGGSNWSMKMNQSYAQDKTIDNICYYVGCRTRGSDWRTGFEKISSNGEDYLNCIAGQFYSSGCARFTVNNLPLASDTVDSVFETDIMFKDSSGRRAQLIVYDSDINGKKIDNVSAGDLSLDYDKWYTYKLIYHHGRYYRTIYERGSEIAAVPEELPIELSSTYGAVYFEIKPASDSTKIGKDQLANLYLDNTKAYTNLEFCDTTVNVTDESGNPIANAVIMIDSISYNTDENGVYTKEDMFAKVYDVTVSAKGYETKTLSLGVFKSNTVRSIKLYEAMPQIMVNGSNITLHADKTDLTVYAAKYENGVLTDVKQFDVTELEQQFDTGFEPDKVFLWGDKQTPVDKWTK